MLLSNARYIRLLFLALCVSFGAQLIAQCTADGGNIALTNGATEYTLIVDGIPDPLDVVRDGSAVGDQSAWVITDANANILALPPAPPFDLDGAGLGTCLIWYLRHDGTLTGAAVGANAATDLGGCFDLSNPITVDRIDAATTNGGNIEFADGTTSQAICVDGTPDPLDVITDGTATGTNRAWVITDTQGNILGLPQAPPFDLDGAGVGTCLIWYLAFEDGLQGAAVGNNAADLMGDFDLSNPITVERSATDGGNITFANGATEYTIIVDGTPDPLDVVRDGSATGTNSAWVITDANANILALPPAPPFDLDGAGLGTCLIWYLRFEDGLTGAAVGNNAADLQGCFDLSNPLTVNRVDASSTNGGNIEFADGTTSQTICVDNTPDPLDVLTDGTASGETRGWVITDTQGNILGLPAAPPFDLDGAGGGTCLIWYIAYNGTLTGAMVGNNASDLQGDFDLSNPITVVRNAPNGGNITFADGSVSQTIVVDGVPDPLDVLLGGSAVGTNSAWVITDDQANILALPAAPPFDLDGAGVGTCLIWYLRYEDGLTGAVVGNNASDLRGCFDLSNPITVERLTGGGGAIATGNIAMPSGATTRYVCPGNDGDITVQLNYSVTGGQVAYAITDSNFDIIGIQNDNVVNAAGAPPGTCYIFAFNYTGNLTGQVGDRVFDTQFSDDSWLISTNGIRVVREAPEGGTIATKDGSTTVYTCIDGNDDFIGFEPSGTSASKYIYVITDANNIVLGTNTQGFQNFEGAGVGECRVWGLSYTGALTAQAGDDAAAVELSDRCYDLSENFITVIREDVDGGTVLSNGSERASASASSPVVAYQGSSNSSAAYAYFILNPAQRIVAVTFGSSYDFSSLNSVSDTYYVYGVSHNGNVLIGPGDEFWGRAITDGCYEISSNALVVSYDPNAQPFTFAATAVDAQHVRLSLPEVTTDDLAADAAQPLLVRITDTYGRLLLEQRVADRQALDGLVLETRQAMAGIHLVSVQEANALSTQKVLLSGR